MLTINEVYTLRYIGNPQKYIQTGNTYTFKIKESDSNYCIIKFPF